MSYWWLSNWKCWPNKVSRCDNWWELKLGRTRTKVSRAIGFLKYSRKFLPQNTLSKMYRGIVEPHFRFSCSIWGCCGVTKLQTFQKLQNRAVRIVTKSRFDTPGMALIHSVNWPTVSDIIRSYTAATMYKSLHGLVPEYLSSLFERNSTQNIRKLTKNRCWPIATLPKDQKWAAGNFFSRT